MHKSDKSPVTGYKIAIVNNANLNMERVMTQPELRDPESDEVIQAARYQVQFVYASKRQLRAIRKARVMQGSHKNVQLFGQREDGTHFPVSLKQRQLAS